MQILFTGCSQRQVGVGRNTLGIVLNIPALIKCLVDLGHEVEWRPVVPGENLSLYDKVFVTLQNPNSITSSHLFGAIWAYQTRPDAIIFIEDWQIHSAVNGIAGSKPEGRYRDFIVDRCKHSDLVINNLMIKKVVDNFFDNFEGKFSRPTVVPAFGGGRHHLFDKYIKRDCIQPFDPFFFLHRYTPVKVKEKRKGWILATLTKVPNSRNINKLHWPIARFGSKTEQQRRVPQEQLFMYMCSAWGNAMVEEISPGSGWFRYGYVMGIDAGNITLCKAKDDAEIYGSSYVETINKRNSIESHYSINGLEELAQAQREQYIKGSWSIEQNKSNIESLLQLHS
jgi:hypothetical protein